MKVLLTHEIFPPQIHGGGEIVVAKMAELLSERGIDVKVLTTGDPKIKKYNNIETVRIPVPVYDRRAKITKFAIEFVHQFGREPTDKEVSENLGLILTHVRSDRKYLHGKSISLDDVVYEDGQKTYHDIFPDTKSKNPRDFRKSAWEEF